MSILSYTLEDCEKLAQPDCKGIRRARFVFRAALNPDGPMTLQEYLEAVRHNVYISKEATFFDIEFIVWKRLREIGRKDLSKQLCAKVDSLLQENFELDSETDALKLSQALIDYLTKLAEIHNI